MCYEAFNENKAREDPLYTWNSVNVKDYYHQIALIRFVNIYLTVRERPNKVVLYGDSFQVNFFLGFIRPWLQLKI
jgi:hypothetical protein